MTNDDALSRLRAGLAEDERIARAAFLPTMPGTERWEFDNMQVRTGYSPLPGQHPPTLVVTHTWPNEGEHIARQDPKATLDRAEAIRQVLAEREAEHTRVRASDPAARAYGDGYRAAYDRIVGVLASIYPKPTETGEPT